VSEAILGVAGERSLDLRAGDVVVVNTSATLPAAVPSVTLLDAYPAAAVAQPSRLWVATFDLSDDMVDYLSRAGRPIRYGCPERAWPLSACQTAFARHPAAPRCPARPGPSRRSW
jgi:S-adenosylmethionine:tRNA ribosyltransferase-isomerase